MTARPRLSRLRVALPTAAVVVALTLGLSACSSSEDTVAELHTSVVQVAERAAAGDYAGALAELALLDRDVAAAVDAGHLDQEREQQIRAAMDLVRADLESADVAATPTATPEPSPDGNTTDGGDAPGNSGDAPGNSGNNGNGKGKGKD